ncbi:hypothetical protein TrVFT333_009002 [Trichoderma virens FT-333]|nr:hypothetical protein TrVFT333_009002 [Trichoderma virens FT-333]
MSFSSGPGLAQLVSDKRLQSLSHPRQFVNALLARRQERTTSTALTASAPASSEEDAVPPILPSGEEIAVPTTILRSEGNAVPPTMVPSQEDAISPAPGSSEDNAAPATGPRLAT